MTNIKIKTITRLYLTTLSLIALLLSLNLSSFSQVQRTVEGKSFIRENITLNDEFHFFRDWSKVASFKSGIGETVELFPIVFSLPNKKFELYGLQLDAEVKPQNPTAVIRNSGSGFNLMNKDFIKRSIFIDKADVAKMIAYIERDIIPNLKESYKKKSKEYVFKSKELFFSFLIYEKNARISIHIVDYGPLGNGQGGGDQIEFWTESKIDDIPKLLETIKSFYAGMK
jgi:hypothetical protein